MKRFLQRMATSLAVSVVAFGLVAPVALAQSPSAQDVCKGVAAAGASCSDASGGSTVNNVIRTVVNVLSTLVGIVAVIMIIFAGYKYITSGGDSSNVASAKNTLLFAIVGVVVVAMAQIIVRFVIVQTT